MRSDDTLTFSSGDDPAKTAPSDESGETAELSELESAERQRGVVFANRFEVVKQLGEGGMGQVFRVHDRQIEGREIALKILHPRFSNDPRFRGLFFQEVRAGQSFVSEHVVQVRDTGQMEDGRLFLTMDMVEGENLSTLLKREHSLDSRHALEVTRQALLGLKSGHEKGFIHRDIKPSNLMLRARVPKTEKNSFGVHVLILDFGLANLAKELKSGQVAGTPFYMSPEQVRDERLDARSDLFAVAVVLYEMISGSRPFQGKTMHEVTSSVIETDVAPMIASLEHLSPAIQKILERALQKDREARFQSAGDFIEAIERSKAYRLPTRVAPWLLAVTVGGTIAAGVEGLFLLQRENEIARLNSDVSSQRNLISEKETLIHQRDEQLNKLQSSQTSDLSKAQLELNEAQRKYASTIATKDIEITRLAEGLALAQAEVESLKATDKTRDLEFLRSQVNNMTLEMANMQKRSQELEDKIRDQDKELARVREEGTSDAQRAMGFDILITLVKEGQGASAWQKYLELAKETLAKGDPRGGDFVEALARAAREVSLFDDPGPGHNAREAQHLADAEAALADGERHLRNLETLASAWLGFIPFNGQPRDRLADARGALDAVRAAVDGRRTQVSGEHESAVAQLLAAPLLEGPELLLQHVARYGCEREHATLALELAVDAYADKMVSSDGRLDARKLAEAVELDPWGTALEGKRLPADSEAGRMLLSLWLARGWYVEKQARGTPTLRTSALESREDPPSEGDLWRRILALQLALDPSQGLPTHGTTGFNLYRRTEGGRTSWFKETVPSANADAWTINRETLSLDPLKPNRNTPSTVKREGKVYNFGPWVLDLTAMGAHIGVEVWPVPAEPLPPGLEDVLDQQTLADFQAAEAAQSHECLVVEEKGLRRWFSPRLGLVREEERDTFSKDLVYTDAKRY